MRSVKRDRSNRGEACSYLAPLDPASFTSVQVAPWLMRASEVGATPVAASELAALPVAIDRARTRAMALHPSRQALSHTA